MIKHIVMWKFKDEPINGKTKEENVENVSNELLALDGKIGSLKHIETGINYNEGAQAADLVLITHFDSKDGLDEYQKHPDHQALIPIIKELVNERRVADFEC